jgi:hypothetical protein
MKKVLLVSVTSLVFFLLSCNVSYAQQGSPQGGIKKEVPAQDKPWTPGESPEQKQKEKDKLEKEKQDPQKPLTKRQQRRKMRKEEKAKRKEYEEYHDKIQTKKTRKDMKKNKKRSGNNNINKKPTIFQKIKAFFNKKKRRIPK